MDLKLSEEQLMFKKMFADFCTKEIRPHGEEVDHSEEPPTTLLKKAAENGFWSALVPEEMGGAGMDILTYMMMVEELARADMSVALTLNIHNSLVVKPLLDYGTPSQQDRYLEELAFGDRLGAFAMTESAAGSDSAAIGLEAEQQGDQYCLNGSKNWVSNGTLAGLFLVFAKTQAGITAFLVERETPGLTVGYREKTLGLHGVACNTLYFKDVLISRENILGELGSGLRVALHAIQLSRLGLGAIALGGIERSLEEAVRFSMEHIQFNVPIAKKQAIQNYIADAKVQATALQCMLLHTACMADAGQNYDLEASIVKLYGARAAYEVTNKLLQVHGGYGYMKDYAIERYYRDCRALEIIEGTSQIQQFLIARSIYKKEGLDIRP